MDIDLLKLFVDVARAGSFAAAARNAELDPSVVSRRVAALEAETGVRLFNRTTRRLTLSEAGELYLARIRPLIEELQHAGEEAAALHSSPSGTLRLTASIAFGETRIVPLLGEFQNRFPKLGVDLVLSDERLDLVAERIDLALRLGPAVTGDVVAARAAHTRYRVCASPDLISRLGSPAGPEDLSRYDCIVFTLPEFRTNWLFRDAGGRISTVAVSSKLAISNALALRSATLRGLGAALLADWLVDEDLRTGALVDLFPDHEVTATTFETGVWFVYPSRSFLPGKVKAAMDFLRPRLGLSGDK